MKLFIILTLSMVHSIAFSEVQNNNPNIQNIILLCSVKGNRTSLNSAGKGYSNDEELATQDVNVKISKFKNDFVIFVDGPPDYVSTAGTLKLKGKSYLKLDSVFDENVISINQEYEEPSGLKVSTDIEINRLSGTIKVQNLRVYSKENIMRLLMGTNLFGQCSKASQKPKF